MKQPFEDGWDLEFLSDPSRWGKDLMGNRRCCLKTIEPKGGRPERFGVLYAMEPLKVYESKAMWDAPPTWGEEEFTSLEELCKVWRVD